MELLSLDPTVETLLRLHLADPTGDTELLSRNDLTALYAAAGGSVERTVASALRTIAASEVLVSKKIQSQDLTTDGPAVSAELRALAREWDAKADALEAPADGGGFIGYVTTGQGVRYEGEERRTWWD